MQTHGAPKAKGNNIEMSSSEGTKKGKMIYLRN